LVFGPAGAGKTSLIKTFYKALHSAEIPEDIHKLLAVKSKVANEGTTRFTKLVLKPLGHTEKPPIKTKKGAKYEVKEN
jgi:GTPase SAR1 family protein